MGENEVVLNNGVSWCSQMAHKLLTKTLQNKPKTLKKSPECGKKRVTTNDKTANYQAFTT